MTEPHATPGPIAQSNCTGDEWIHQLGGHASHGSKDGNRDYTRGGGVGQIGQNYIGGETSTDKMCLKWG